MPDADFPPPDLPAPDFHWPQRLVVFLGLAMALWLLLLMVSPREGILRGVLASLGAGYATNWVCARVFERGRTEDFGLGLGARALWQAALGLGLGLGAVVALTLGALGLGAASLEMAQPDRADLAWLTALLLGGAAGEELLFRGYAFQLAARRTYPGLVIAASGALFGAAHLALNPNIGALGTANTALWGALLGYACWRSGALWMPIGLHFGWNLGLVLTGQTLSGITMKAAAVRLVWNAGEPWSGGEYGPEGGLPATVLALLVFVGVKATVRRER